MYGSGQRTTCYRPGHVHRAYVRIEARGKKMKYKVVMHYPDGTDEEEDELYDSEEQAEEAAATAAPAIVRAERFSIFRTPAIIRSTKTTVISKSSRSTSSRTSEINLQVPRPASESRPRTARTPFPGHQKSESSSPAEPALDRAASVQASLDARVVVPVDISSPNPSEDIGAVSSQSW